MTKNIAETLAADTTICQ